MDFNIDEDTTIGDISHKARIPSLVSHVLAERIEPRDIGTALHVFLARQIANILVVESLFRHGWPQPDLAEYYQRLCEDRDEALRQFKIESPYPARSI